MLTPTRSVLLPLTLLSAVAVGGCGGSSVKTIGPGGGTVSFGTGASVIVPPGALKTNVDITVTPTTGTAPSGVASVGAFYSFGPDGTQFAAPVTVVIAYNTRILPAGDQASDIVIYTAPTGTPNWTALSTTVADSDHVQATTTHFSTFFAGAPVSTALDLGLYDGEANNDL